MWIMPKARESVTVMSIYMGHFNIAITYDRYGTLCPGNEARGGGSAGWLPEGAGDEGACWAPGSSQSFDNLLTNKTKSSPRSQ